MLQERYDSIQTERDIFAKRLSDVSENTQNAFAHTDDELQIEFAITGEDESEKRRLTKIVTTTWAELFAAICSGLLTPCPEWQVRRTLLDFFNPSVNLPGKQHIQLPDRLLETIRLQFVALDYIELASQPAREQGVASPAFRRYLNDPEMTWCLTPRGVREYVRSRAAPRGSQTFVASE